MSSGGNLTTGPSLQILAELRGLPDAWHTAGNLDRAALEAIARHLGSGPVAHTMETGTGKSTLLLSHLSKKHKVFTLAGEHDNSYTTVVESPLLNRDNVEFVLGPTQITLPTHRFREPLQFALIDGPHGYPFPELEYFYIYPHLETGALLVVDDIHIPSIFNLFRFLREDAMFDLLRVVGTTAIFKRTDAPAFPPMEDNWWTQQYNVVRFPVSGWPRWGSLKFRIRNAVPIAARNRLKRFLPARARRWLSS